MKRTTYIMIGMLVAGVVMIGGWIFLAMCCNGALKDNFIEIGGARKTVQLPPCKVVKLTQPPIVWKQINEGIVEAERIFSFRQVPLKVLSDDSLRQGSFSYAGEMEAFMKMASVGDTLLVTFDIPDEKIEELPRSRGLVKARSEEMALSLPVCVQTVIVEVEDLETAFCGMRGDRFSFRVRHKARVEGCDVESLDAQAQYLYFNRGKVGNLWLNLDEISSWIVNADSFSIDTEQLSGKRSHHCLLQKGECRRVLWTPLGENASLNVELKQAADIEVSE